jgi:hypothetical protein
VQNLRNKKPEEQKPLEHKPFEQMSFEQMFKECMSLQHVCKSAATRTIVVRANVNR